MAGQRKAAPRRRSKKPAQRKTSDFRKTVRALVASTLATFGIASCVINPDLREAIPLDSLLQQVGLKAPASVAISAPAGNPVATTFKDCPQFFPGQPPVVIATPAMRELCFSAFAILHNGQTKTPIVVAQRLNRKMLAQDVARSDRFYAEARLPASERAELADYRNSGYSRGHLAPAGDMHTQEAMAQSFSLANMVPQNQVHNGGAWNKIEADTRKYIQRAPGDVYVFTGPVYSGHPATIGAGKVAVPAYLYKVVYDATTGRTWVHWQANSPDTKAGAPISYQEFVQRTGLRLLPGG